MVMWLVLSRVESNNCGCVSLGLVSESGGRVKDHRFVWIVLGKFKCRKLVTIKIRNLYMNKSVEALISFNKGNQGLLKLHVFWGGSVSVWGKKGGCVMFHCFREVQCQQVYTTGIWYLVFDVIAWYCW